MKVNEIFITVSSYADVDQFKFLLLFNETINEINLMYPVIDNLKTTNDINSFYEYPEMFVSPIKDNILFLLGFGDKYKSEFIRKMKYAFCGWWKNKSKKTGFVRRSEC